MGHLLQRRDRSGIVLQVAEVRVRGAHYLEQVKW